MNNYRFEDLYEDLSVSFEETVTEEMMDAFWLISGDENPLHMKKEFAQSQGYKDRVVYGMLTSSLLSQLVGVHLPGKYCLLQGMELKYLNPVYVGDTLTVKGTVYELHPSVKMAVIKALITNQDGVKVVRGKINVGFLQYEDE
ncbi:MAG: MaoC family dehydratase [Erysipelotrichaceae bacterium]|nr:MaoC family dehydratase [Erysipelotrichaceae bacterium]